jgi:hypothetical protein
LGLVIPARAQATFLTSLSGEAVQNPSDGLYTYTYLVTNLSASTDTFGALNVNVSPSAGVLSIAGPDGWLSSFDTADSLVQWFSPGPTSDISPGSSGAFSFVSPLPPVAQDYLAIGFSDVGIDFNPRTTVGPGVVTTVPEPSTLTLLGVAAAGCLTCGWCRRLRSAHVPVPR